jgi:hypothetical protein
MEVNFAVTFKWELTAKTVEPWVLPSAAGEQRSCQLRLDANNN